MSNVLLDQFGVVFTFQNCDFAFFHVANTPFQFAPSTSLLIRSSHPHFFTTTLVVEKSQTAVERKKVEKTQPPENKNFSGKGKMGVGTQKKKIKRTQPQNNYFGVNSYEIVGRWQGDDFYFTRVLISNCVNADI